MLHFNAGQAKDSGACAQLSLALSPFYLSPPGFGVDGHGLGRDAAEDEHDVLHVPRWPFHAAEVAAHHAGRALQAGWDAGAQRREHSVEVVARGSSSSCRLDRSSVSVLKTQFYRG